MPCLRPGNVVNIATTGIPTNLVSSNPLACTVIADGASLTISGAYNSNRTPAIGVSTISWIDDSGPNALEVDVTYSPQGAELITSNNTTYAITPITTSQNGPGTSTQEFQLSVGTVPWSPDLTQGQMLYVNIDTTAQTFSLTAPQNMQANSEEVTLIIQNTSGSTVQATLSNTFILSMPDTLNIAIGDTVIFKMAYDSVNAAWRQTTPMFHLNPYTADGTSIVVGVAAGTGGSVTLGANSNEDRGIINVVTGTSTTTNAIIATVTFGLTQNTTPMGVILSPANVVTAELPIGEIPIVTGISATGFVLTSGTTALAASTTYKWLYKVIL